MYWFRYIETCCVISAWDTISHALNGCDFDGDLFYITDNKVILENTRVLPAIECIQRRAEKKIVTEEDLVIANKNSFGDAIGSTTNKITSQIERQALFEKGSDEYKALEYRIMCGQHFQQTSIDKAKGIIAKPMPVYWYNMMDNYIKEGDDEETKQLKKFNARICADKKPYFMMYRYPALMKEYRKYVKSENSRCMSMFGKTVKELLSSTDLTEDEEEFVRWYNKELPVGASEFVTNKICWRFEEEFDGVVKTNAPDAEFDYTILKNESEYKKSEFKKIKEIYDDFTVHAIECNSKKNKAYSNSEIEDANQQYNLNMERFIERCTEVCPNEDVLCNIVLDLCYKNNTSKKFAWAMCGETIIKNLLKKNGNIMHVPVADKDGDIEFRGERFSIQEVIIEEERDDEFCDE